jgi:hypothetical protein
MPARHSARLTLVGEPAAAGHILAGAGIRVQATHPARPLPTAADAVLALVLREAVTNILLAPKSRERCYLSATGNPVGTSSRKRQATFGRRTWAKDGIRDRIAAITAR